MAYKILTKNGIDNSNIDGARGEYFNSGILHGSSVAKIYQIAKVIE